MLTKSDLDQIRKVFREEIENEAQVIKDTIGADITSSQIRIRSEISELKDRIKNLEIRMGKEHKEVKDEIKMVSDFLDKENMNTLKRVKKLEEHVHRNIQ